MEVGFLLKKSISYVLEPFGMVLVLFFVGLYFLYTRKCKQSKIFLTLSFFTMFLYAYPPFSNFLITNLENQYPKYEYNSQVKYIHVLGSGHNTDSTQPLSSQVGDASIKRDVEGIIIHFKTDYSKIIFTGYEGFTDVATATMNANLAKALGVDKENLIISPKPKDTQEEALFAKTIVGEEPFVLVTSATHMPRAILLFRSLGLNPIPAPTNFYKEEMDSYLKLPRIGSFYKSQIAVHEYLGIVWGKLKASI